MTGFSLLHPWGLLGLAALFVVVLIYLFYERHRPHRISGLFLWDAPMAAYKGGQRLEPPQLTRSLLLDLLAAALLALAIATPACISRAGSPLVLILDGSLSMRAGGNHLKVKEAAQRLARAHPDGTVLVIEAGATPRVLAQPGVKAETVEAAIEAFDPFDPGDSLIDALALSRELVTGRAEIHLFTDRPVSLPAPAMSRLERHLLPGRQPNLALVEATRRYPPFGSTERLSVAVAAFGDAPTGATLRIRDGAKTVHEQRIDLEPGTPYRVSLELPAGKGPLEVSVEPAGGADSSRDALLEDSRASLLPAPRRPVRASVSLATPAAEPVRRALRAAGAVLGETAAGSDGATPTGAESIPLTPADLLVTDSAPARGAVFTLYFRPLQGKPTTWLGPFVIDAAHPLCQDLDLTGIYWTADAALEAPADAGPPLISIERRPLFRAVAEDRLELNLDPARSNLPRSPAWPVLFANLVRAVEERLPGLHRVNHLPGSRLRWIPYSDPQRNPDRVVWAPDAEAGGLELPWRNLSTPLTLPGRPGHYELRNGATVLEAITINALAPAESDLRGLADTESTEVIAGSDGDGGALASSRLGWLFAALALGAVGLNWWLERREDG